MPADANPVQKGDGPSKPGISVIIPTYGREEVLLDTIDYLLKTEPPPSEILVIDQTPVHEPATAERLERLTASGAMNRICLDRPSITHAMNVGLLEARNDIVLFLDDDIIPDKGLVAAHARDHEEPGVTIVAGRVLQPWEEGVPADDGAGLFRFSSVKRQWISELMGGNFSIKRRTALQIGGFDENFVRVAYRFEAEFAERALAAGERILFEPEAGIRHLKAERGGTRSFGHHLTTIKPGHAVGAYYYHLRTGSLSERFRGMTGRLCRSVTTRHHLRRPWWIVPTLVAELSGLLWALFLASRGPRLLDGGDRRGTT